MLKLIQWYYHFLCLWKFLEQVIITNDLSELAMDLPIKTGEKSSFMLKEKQIKQLFSSIHSHPEKRNVYWYLTEISAFKWIFSITRELIENDENFRNYLKNLLQDQYFPFEQTIRFLRNVLNHATSSNITLKTEDYEIQKDFILSPKVQRVNQLKWSATIKLNFIYSKYIKQWQWNKNYWFKNDIDFKKLKPNIPLENLVSRHNLYLLAELCFNISKIAEKNTNLKRPTRQIQRKSHWNTKPKK